MENQIDRIMRSLRCTKAEAEAILAEDRKIDRGERVEFDLDPETEKQAKKYANTGTRVPKGEKTARKPKENPTKEGVIAEIAQFLIQKDYGSVEITNKTRQIAFELGGDSYELTLIAKRKSKN